MFDVPEKENHAVYTVHYTDRRCQKKNVIKKSKIQASSNSHYHLSYGHAGRRHMHVREMAWTGRREKLLKPFAY